MPSSSSPAAGTNLGPRTSGCPHHLDADAAFKDAHIIPTLKHLYPVSIVVAMTPERGIGFKQQLPWPHIPTDFRFFSHLTQLTSPGSTRGRNVVVMGRKTWDSLPVKSKPLKNRLNVVISSTLTDDDIRNAGALGEDSVRVAPSLPAALELLEKEYTPAEIHQVFVIGGSLLYASALALGVAQRLYITRISKSFACDTFFPSFGKVVTLKSDSTPVLNEASKENAVVNCSRSLNGSSVGNSLDIENPQTVRQGEPQLGGDSGLWASLTSNFEVTYISKSHSHGEVPFDFVVMEKRGRESNYLEKATGGSEEQVNGAMDPRQHPHAACMLFDGNKFNDFGRVRAAPAVYGRYHEEFQYLDLIADILNTGAEQPDRTGVGVISKFGAQMRFSLKETFPLLTTKRVFWRGVVEELLWFIKGDTNANHLSERGVKIWEQNATREFLDGRGLYHREQGDIGPVYGFQWRHFGAKYKDMHTDYSGQGVDQLQQVIHQLKTNPFDRRIIMTAWNPTVMLAHICGYAPGEFVHCLGNAHVYMNHIDALKSQIQREPRPFPVLRIKDTHIQNIEEFTTESFELIGYNPHGPIKMQMAV